MGTCLKDGSYNADPPSCVEANSKRLPDPVKEDDLGPPVIRKRPVFSDPKRTRPGSGNEDTGERRRPFGRGPFPKKPIDFSPDSPRSLRPRKKDPQLRPELRPRPPIDNEIPDSANVQNSPAAAESRRNHRLGSLWWLCLPRRNHHHNCHSHQKGEQRAPHWQARRVSDQQPES